MNNNINLYEAETRRGNMSLRSEGLYGIVDPKFEMRGSNCLVRSFAESVVGSATVAFSSARNESS